MGGKTTVEAPPAAPSPGESYAAAINAEIESLPARLAAEQKYRPQFDAINVASMERFAPQLASLAENLARREQAIQRELNPAKFAAEEALGRRIAGLGQGLLPEEESAFRRRFAAEEGLGGRLGSEIGSASIARKLALADMARDAQVASEALSLSGRLPTLGGQTVSIPQTAGAPTLTGSSVGTQLGLAGQLAGVNANIFGTQAQAATAARGQNIDLLSGIGGTIFAQGGLSKAIPGFLGL